ncbi:MAG: aminopeptidase P family protein [Elusimicrobiota bacterium]
MIKTERIESLKDRVKRENLEAIVVTGMSDLTYLTELRMEGYWMVVGRKNYWVITNRLLSGAFEAMDVPEASLIVQMDFKVALTELVQKSSFHAVGFDGETVPYGLGSYFEHQGYKHCPHFIEPLRAVKDKEELAHLKKSCQITARSMAFIGKKLKSGMTEKAAAYQIEDFMRKQGAERTSFDLIVGSGPNSAIPHHRTAERKIQDGDAVVVDIGCVFNNYCSDMTRTFFVGKKPDELFSKVHKIVAESQKAGIKAVKHGLLGKDIDKVCRGHIEKEGYGKEFTHGTGHGVGLDIHESPWVRSVSENKLGAGMIITVEPGIYLDGRFGVRIEDTVLVTKTGAEVLTKA